jgi:hypothetical protein
VHLRRLRGEGKRAFGQHVGSTPELTLGAT